MTCPRDNTSQKNNSAFGAENIVKHIEMHIISFTYPRNTSPDFFGRADAVGRVANLVNLVKCRGVILGGAVFPDRAIPRDLL